MEVPFRTGDAVTAFCGQASDKSHVHCVARASSAPDSLGGADSRYVVAGVDARGGGGLELHRVCPSGAGSDLSDNAKTGLGREPRLLGGFSLRVRLHS